MLAHAHREESRSSRGRLKVFFGAAPGVGKTYAMLNAAQRLAREGLDVVAGIVETHKRSETEQMLLGLDILPRRSAEYRGADGAATPVTLHEFDLDAAIARKPEILLLDELAHTNAPGSRFEKRWQDVQECLQAGINVYTTLNVQHIESLNDVISKITGVTVKETVPDSVLEEADEIELVDLPPDVLLERLKSGRVYVPETVRHAVDSFFRKGNLTALRELALRRTAHWVDTQMRSYKADRGIRAIWPTTERILVAVSPSPMSGKLVRAAKRMAAGLHADLIAAYVETPRTANLSQVDREQVVQTLRLAESLGAETTTLTATNAATELVTFARTRNVNKIIVGKTRFSRLRESIFGSFVNNLIRQSGDIDVYVIRGDSDESSSPVERSSRLTRHQSGLLQYALGIALVGTATGLAAALFGRVELANVVMIYLAAVVVAAVWLGRGPAVLAAVLGVGTFDYFFVTPRWSFAVSDAQYLLTFVVMLAVGLLIASLTTRLRELAGAARERERRTAALYAMSKELSAAQSRRDVATAAVQHVHDTFGCDTVLAAPVPGAGSVGLDALAAAGNPDWFDEREQGVGRWAFDHGKSAGHGTQTLPSAVARYLPLSGSQGKAGVLAVRPKEARSFLGTSQLLLLDTFANQIAIALERVSLIENQQATRIEVEGERLRSALLSSVSHDLRTPLASIAGAASTLDQSGESLDPATRRELTRSIVHESERLNDLIANLVFATRLEAGGIHLRREWTTIEEIVGTGLARHREALAQRPFRTSISASLPLLRVDNAMLPQVVHNLVENALRYTPAGTPISISAWATDTHVVVKVADEGPGLGDDEASKVFQRFYKGRTARASDDRATRGGMGLGLTICEGIVKAHQGRIWAEKGSPRGVAFLLALPIERPQPEMPFEAAEEAR